LIKYLWLKKQREFNTTTSPNSTQGRQTSRLLLTGGLEK